jgi:(2Fe-2S) ferredoxin
VPRIGGIGGPYRFFFTSFDCSEPPHVHVERESSLCKCWLEPVMLARNHGFAAHELNRIRRIIQEHHARIMEAWHEHCGEN